MRLLVHVHDVKMMTCVDESATVFELRKSVERQYGDLNPNQPPLATHALRDAQDYLLPDSLRAGSVLEDRQEIFVVLETSLRPAGEADLDQVLSRWKYFQNYTVASLATSIKKHQRQNRSLEDLPTGVVLVLAELLSCTDLSTVSESSRLMRTLLCEPSGSPACLGLCESPENAGYRCLKFICSLGQFTTQEDVARHCAAILHSCIYYPGTKKAAVRSGVSGALMKLSRSQDTETRKFATKGLLGLSHTERSSSGSGKRRIGQSGEGKNQDTIFNVEQALETLEQSDLPELQQMALEVVLRECNEEPFGNLIALEPLRVSDAFSRVCHSQNTTLCRLVGNILFQLVNSKSDSADLVFRFGGFELLLQLTEEEEEYQTRNLHESKGPDFGIHFVFPDMLRSVCTSKACPLKLLVDTLSRSASAQVRMIVAEVLVPRAKQDDDNELFSFISHLLSCATQALEDVASDTLGLENELPHVANVLSIMTVKQMNKAQMIKYGSPTFFVSTLALDNVVLSDGLTTSKRAAAKALANLASASDENRAIIIEALQRGCPPIDGFHDSIIKMYLDMVFTNT